MTPDEISQYQSALLRLKKRVAGDLSELEEEALRPGGGESAGNLSDLPTHPADLGTETFEEEISVTLVENEDRMLQEINEALARVEKATFGTCENCHQPISRERLRALPYARYCIGWHGKSKAAPCRERMLATPRNKRGLAAMLEAKIIDRGRGPEVAKGTVVDVALCSA